MIVLNKFKRLEEVECSVVLTTGLHAEIIVEIIIIEIG